MNKLTRTMTILSSGLLQAGHKIALSCCKCICKYVCKYICDQVTQKVGL